MPFIVRKIEPRYIGRGHVPQDNSCVEIWPVGAELEAIINGALACTLKQLASLLTNAQDIFQGLNDELGDVANRSGILRQRIHKLDNKLSSIDPKKIPVPESDISSFAARTQHFKSLQTPTTGLFAETTRPKALKKLYQQASVIAVRNFDYSRLNHNENDTTAVEMFLCTPILGKRRRDQSLDIESRVPAIFDDLRRWTSSEALGDITVPPDCMSRIIQPSDSDFTSDDAVDHKLPSPEEQFQVVALKFPGEVVAVDISGKGFARMSMRKKLTVSQITSELNSGNDTTVKRRSKIRHGTSRTKNKRRNTIAGTDGKEIKQAIAEDSTANKTNNKDCKSKSTGVTAKTRCVRSISTDILQERETEFTKWNFETLKAWGRSRFRSMRRQSSDIDKNIKSTSNFGSCSGVDINNDKITSENNDSKDLMVNKTNIKGEFEESEDERKPSFSSISITDSVTTSGIALSSTTTMHTFDKNLRQQSHQKRQQLHHKHANNILYDVRLRESAAQRRERRKGNNTREDPIHSSSGNWSASSESGRTSSIGSEIVSSNLPVRSSSSSSSSKLLSHNQRRLKGRDTPTSSSVTSEASTLTPDIIQDIITYPDDCETEGETCSIYSCDTEGYYTSFHMDSGLKTLREEELAAATAACIETFNTSANNQITHQIPVNLKSDINTQNQIQLIPSNQNAIVENEYELFGRGSTSTTTSSAGTVCTTLMAAAPPAPPERKSSLTVVAMVHGQNGGGNSPDSGHNTCSSPVESASASSPACYTARSCSELEYSESSDLEGYDRIERIRYKTAISTNRIPSMCVITPSGSDDEQGQSQQQKQQQQLIYSDKMTVQLHDTNELVKENVVGDNINNCHDSGDYVTIADFRNNDRYRGHVGKVYANVERKNSMSQQQEQFNNNNLQEFEQAEYVSLSELPKKSDCSLERKRRQGARVVLDYQGKVIYSSDSLKRRKESHTTFNPGPFIKESSPIIAAINRSDKARSESPREIRKPRAFVNLGNQYHHQQGELELPTTSEKRGAEKAGEVEDSNWISGEDEVDSHTENKLQHQRNVINVKSKSLSGQILDSNNKFASSASLYRQSTPDITRDLGSKLNNYQIQYQDSKIHNNNSLDNKKYGNYQSQRYLMPLNLNTYDGNNQIITSSPLSQKLKENQPSENVKDLFYNSTLSPINNQSSSSPSSINNLVKNNKTMSNDELFTAIYKSKRKLNIRNDNEVTSGTVNDDSLIDITNNVPDNNKIGTRHSWSPETQNNIKFLSPSCINQEMSPKNTKTSAAMTRLDFKRLLLQQSTKNRSSNLSAAEQLKLSNPTRGLGGRQVTNSHNNNIQSTPTTVKSLNPLSPINQRSNSLGGLSRQQKIIPYSNKHESASPQRSIWKYQTPRSNILSCTIIEDVVAEETAVKQFLESPTSESQPAATASISDSNDKNIFSNKDLKSTSNNSNFKSAIFEAESIKKRNNQLKAQFLSSNTISDNNSSEENNKIQSESLINNDLDDKLPIVGNNQVRNNTSALETAL